MIIHIILICIIFVLCVILLTHRCYNQENMLAYNTISEEDYNIYHYDKDCVLRCGDHNSCMRLKYRTDNYFKCKNCESKNKYLYHDIVSYTCNKNKDKYKKDIKCNFDIGLGCPNYNNITSNKMIQPYYIMKNSYKDFGKTKYNNFTLTDKCTFCWNLI